ncbi:bile acid:sodium symporter family protein [Marinospirillum alkaliphilum]|uniref:Bile acid:Na+ symporter, BASS family n=1 Tax=Marinospirillum alkaliphilum DSM 21637 TaxID=1122209 RepID=A0A1K1W370_9GAMM|nr:bile acid:sodium symporter family protein [Marinospirillum alkaliphilum]SFX31826.1 bile acid:Na+ symporter, BASS family [Marinospirillum alkaliphilum DSM 21637]
MGQDLLLTVLLPAALFLIMLGMGMTLSVNDFMRVRQAPAAVLTGLSGQFLLPPLAALLAIWVFDPEPVFAVGLMVLAFAPSGATSNLMTFLSRGDVALSVTLTAITSLIIPFTLPVLSALAISHWLGQSADIELPLLRTWAQLMLVSLFPILLGMLVASNWPTLAGRATQALKPLSFAFLLLVIVAISSKHWERMPAFLVATAPAVLLMNCVALLAGWLWARLWQQDAQRQITIGLEVGVQNGGTALVVTLMVLGNAQMSVPPVIYGILMLGPSLAFGLLFGAHLSRRMQASEA